MNKEIRTVFIVDKHREYALNVLHGFRSEFDEYIKTYNSHLGQVTLTNSVDIIAIGEGESKMRLTGTRNYAVYGADYFMGICYRDAYYAAKHEIKILKELLAEEE